MAKHTIQHSLSPELVKKVTEKAFETYSQKFASYSPTSSWPTPTRNDISFTALGKTLKGSINLRPSEVELELDVPMILRPFQKKAMAIIDEEIREWIERAKKGEIA